MASVHPSRMSQVPADSRDSYYSRRRDPSPMRTSHQDYKTRSEERNRNDRTTENQSSGRSRSKETRTRRQSPEYSAYRRPRSSSPTREGNQMPWKQEQNMYPNRRERVGSSDYLESRRLQRESATATVWPPSPKAPARDLSPDSDYRRHKRSKRRNRSPLSDEPTDESSEEERRRQEKKQRKRTKRDKDKETEDRKDSSRRKSQRKNHGKEDERHARTDRHRRSSSQCTMTPEKSPSRKLEEHVEDEWVEKPVEDGVMAPPRAPSSSLHTREKKNVDSSIEHLGDDDSDDEVGPLPAQVVGGKANKRIDERQYGGALLRGEGSAMAAFLQDDTNVRIPRRGEIGLTSDEIATFEQVGYVMSGSRHKRMNAVRIRKENQVISAEERRGILKLQKEERERRESVLREEFQELMNEKLKGASSRTSSTQ